MTKKFSLLLTALAATALLVGCNSGTATDGNTNPVADAKTADQMNTPAAETPSSESGMGQAPVDKDDMGMEGDKGTMMDNGAKSSDTTPADAPMVDKDGNKVVAFTNADGKLVCPVMGNEISSAKDAVGYQDYKGKRYYFCCDGCPQSFKADPDKYADGKALKPTAKN